jgi:hypothetical protein
MNKEEKINKKLNKIIEWTKIKIRIIKGERKNIFS